jgi:hypothetical protein
VTGQVYVYQFCLYLYDFSIIFCGILFFVFCFHDFFLSFTVSISFINEPILAIYIKFSMEFKGVDLGYPKIFPSFNFFSSNLHHGIVMSKYIICQSFKKIHRAVFSIAHPKYSNFGGILDARWLY